MAVATADLNRAIAVIEGSFQIETFPHSLNVSKTGSKLRLQVQTDPRYSDFVYRAEVRDVLDVPLPVASLRDVLQGKVWAALDDSRQPSKRRKDLLDIERLIEQFPELRGDVPADLLDQL